MGQFKPTNATPLLLCQEAAGYQGVNGLFAGLATAAARRSSQGVFGGNGIAVPAAANKPVFYIVAQGRRLPVEAFFVINIKDIITRGY